MRLFCIMLQGGFHPVVRKIQRASFVRNNCNLTDKVCLYVLHSATVQHAKARVWVSLKKRKRVMWFPQRRH
jgi:hypothetical protein